MAAVRLVPSSVSNGSHVSALFCARLLRNTFGQQNTYACSSKLMRSEECFVAGEFRWEEPVVTEEEQARRDKEAALELKKAKSNKPPAEKKQDSAASAEQQIKSREDEPAVQVKHRALLDVQVAGSTNRGRKAGN